MKRILPLMLVIPIAAYAYACSNKSEDPAPPTDPSTPGDPDPGTGNPDPGTGNPDPGTGNPDPGTTDPNANPIEGIAEAKPILQTDAFTDGPIWHEAQGVLFFATPLGNGALYRMRPDGSAKKVRDGDPASGSIPIGNTVDKAGNLINIMSQNIVRGGAAVDAGALETIANGWTNNTVFQKFDTLNDAVVRDDGVMFVTDPGYFGTPVANRIFRVAADKTVTVADAFEDVPRPNGIAFMPGQTELLVGFSQPMEGTMPYIRKYHLNEDGTLGEAAKFIDVDPADSAPDGIEVDTSGNIYVATKAGIAVYKNDGTKLGVVPVPEVPTGMAFGNKDMKSLYVTTQGTRIWELRVNVPGIAQ